MKNFKIWLVILPLLTTACSDEYVTDKTESSQGNLMKKSDPEPGNSANPYDLAGSVHNAILETLDSTDLDSLSIEDVAYLVDSIAIVQTELAHLPAASALSTKITEITWLVNDEDAIEDVLELSPLGSSAQTSLGTFINSALLLANAPYKDIYSMITGYEATVLSSAGFTNNEKRIILTTTSIVRYSFYRKKRKDKDWETNVGNIAATVSGAEEGTVMGLKMAVTVGACINNNIDQ